MKKLIIIFVIILALTLEVVNLAWAKNTQLSLDNTTPPPLGNTTPPPAPNTKQANLQNPLGNKNVGITEVVVRIIKVFLGILGTISLVMFIYGGILMLTSAGKAEQIKKGQQTLVWASLGILVIFTSYAILKFVFSVFGL